MDVIQSEFVRGEICVFFFTLLIVFGYINKKKRELKKKHTNSGENQMTYK